METDVKEKVSVRGPAVRDAVRLFFRDTDAALSFGAMLIKSFLDTVILNETTYRHYLKRHGERLNDLAWACLFYEVIPAEEREHVADALPRDDRFRVFQKLAIRHHVGEWQGDLKFNQLPGALLSEVLYDLPKGRVRSGLDPVFREVTHELAKRHEYWYLSGLAALRTEAGEAVVAPEVRTEAGEAVVAPDVRTEAGETVVAPESRVGRYRNARRKSEEAALERALAYSVLSTAEVVQVRGAAQILIAVLAAIALCLYAIAHITGSGFPITLAQAADTVAPSQPVAVRPFIPPMGITLSDWRWMTIAIFVLMIIIVLSVIYKGLLAKEKNERAGDLAERFSLLVVGLFLGKFT